MKRPTIYFSIDVEADGPIPGPYSMLQLGAAAFHSDRFTPCDDAGTSQVIGTFTSNLKPIPGATQHPDTMEWWDKQDPAVWENVTRDPLHPRAAMEAFHSWIRFECGRNDNAMPVIVGYPATYDFMFVYWYSVNFCGFPTPYGFQGLDVKTLAAEKMGVPFKQAAKRRFPKSWFRGCPPHTHIAVEDAIGQGVMFMNMQAED